MVDRSTGSGYPSAEEIRRWADEVIERIEAARPVAGPPVRLVAVTKAFGIDVVERALEAGLTDLGENYAQELAAKAAKLEAGAGAGEGGPRWHFIGALQRNKVKLLAGKVHLWQTVDRAALADEIAKRSPGDRVLVQVNTTSEPQKAGCDPAETERLVERAANLGLLVEGLMTIGPTAPGADPRPAFELLRGLADRCAVAELSMGMSGDYEIAVAEGATIVRVGSALFGPRPALAEGSAPDSGASKGGA